MKKYTYFKAELSMICHRVDEAEFYDNGIIQTFTAKTKDELKEKIERVYDLSEWEKIEANRLSVAGESIEEPGIIEDLSLYFYEVSETEIEIEEV